ncbi:Ankyrin repeat and Ankyrin repeat-containing domain-containing protein [Strongyloides ratti]|uniref:Ankyrin repeat and Ankyrin repeat-containing domain-containing protein n=1 Tax=Strongyloides ratti TaxID=34506 RepID=A0A090LNT3_STRRB|nr:Ankyrin repeat and Ankyrin repeat-containing domain-containing protein [Strongyloides ratti]CEF71426.1 Ankyrin repeat and Ankyrin repeat-containing domain-containing protein [Strongyloides ratti]
MNINNKVFLALCEEGNYEEIRKLLDEKSKNNFLRFLRRIFKKKHSNRNNLNKIKDPKNEYSPLHYGVLGNNINLVKILLQNDPSLIYTTDVKGSYPISLAAYNGYYDIVELLLENDIKMVNFTNNAKDTPLHLASMNGHVKVVSLLLNRHCDTKIKNARQESALDVACKYGHVQVCQILIVHCPEFVIQSKTDSHFVEAGNNDIKNMYPLHICAQNGHSKCLNYLCESGFDVNHTLKEGTALHIAAVYGHINCIFILLKHGINTKILNERGLDVIGELDAHINHHGTNITQMMENKDIWIEEKKIIEDFNRGVSVPILEMSQNMNNNKIWINVPDTINTKNNNENNIEDNGKNVIKKPFTNFDSQFQNELKEKLEKRQAKANDLQEIYKQLSNVTKIDDSIFNRNNTLPKNDKYKTTADKPPISPTSSLKSNSNDSEKNCNKFLNKPLIDEKNINKQFLNTCDKNIIKPIMKDISIKIGTQSQTSTIKDNDEQKQISYDNVPQTIVEAQKIINCHIQSKETLDNESNHKEVISTTTNKFPKTKEEVYKIINEIKSNEIIKEKEVEISNCKEDNTDGTFRYDNLNDVWKDMEVNKDKNTIINKEKDEKNDGCCNEIIDNSCKESSPKTKSLPMKKVTFEEIEYKNDLREK